MTSRGLLRSAVLIEVMVSASCAADMTDRADPAGSSDADPIEVAGKDSALMGETGACLDPNVLRTQFDYDSDVLENRQISSSSVATDQQEWWNRTDCAAFVVDFARGSTASADFRVGRAAFFSGIIDHNIAAQLMTSTENCQLGHISKQIVSHLEDTDPSRWDTVLDIGEKTGCGWEPVWLGSTYEDEPFESWYVVQDRVRVVVQGWVYVFPVAVEAYMQNDTDRGCPTLEACCYKGQPLQECR
jgi:hypothetical protein